MSKTKLFAFFILVFVTSCEKKNEVVYSVIPEISSLQTSYYSSANGGISDSIVISFSVRDGDFDLGLSPNDVDAPFNNRFYFLKTGEKITDNQNIPGSNLLSFGDKKTLNPDTLPPFISPYSCERWLVNATPNDADTIYFQENPNYYNLVVTVYIQSADKSSFIPFDFATAFDYPACIPWGFNSRFPKPSANQIPFSFSNITSQEVTINYSIVGQWGQFFAGKVLKVSVQIKDRALHKSNIILSDAFTF